MSVELPQNTVAFTFIGWRPDHLAFYIRDESGVPKIVLLSHVYPECPENQIFFKFPDHAPEAFFSIWFTGTFPPGTTVADVNGKMQKIRQFCDQLTILADEIRRSGGSVSYDENFCLGQIRYAIKFCSGPTYYLSNVATSDLLTAGQAEEFAKLEAGNLAGAGTQPTQDAAQAASTPAPAFNPDSQFEYVNLEGTEWRKAGPQMVRRRQLAEHQRTTKNDSSFRGLLELHRERWFYPVKQVFKVREADKQGKAARVAAKFDITDWDSKWHPPSAPNWQHPGKKSSHSEANRS